MASHNFGIEVELIGISRKDASVLVAKYLNTEVIQKSIKRTVMIDSKGREWFITNDRSIRPQLAKIIDNEEVTEEFLNTHRVELITPILTEDDTEILGDIINLLIANGAVVNETCGIHVHLDDCGHTVESLRKLVNIFDINTQNLYKELNVRTNRLKYCRKLSRRLVNRINSEQVKNLEQFKDAWYAEYPNDERDKKTNRTRYYGLNLHSLFHSHNIEFRIFNATLDIKEIMTYVKLCIDMNDYSISNETNKEVIYTSIYKVEEEMGNLEVAL